jgi:hypothetical protein
VQFLCYEIVFCVVLDVSHHLFFINNLKILNSNVLRKWSFSAFSQAENAFSEHPFSEDKRKNVAIFMFRSRVLCGSG